MSFAFIALGALALIIILAISGAAAFAIAYPFALVAKRADERIAQHIAVQRRLDTPGYVLKRVWG